MKKKSLILIVGAVIVAAATVFIWMRREADWAFVGQATGFRFPAGTEYLAQYDNGEWFVVSVVRLPDNSVSAFVRQHRFYTGVRRDMHTASSLPEKYRQIPDRADVLSASGQKEYQSWEAILDPQRRFLWIHVSYPDSGGTHSGTAPQPPNK